MSQGFDSSVPATASGLTSAPVRTNFNALLTNHLGTSAPSGAGLPIKGQLWMDTNDPANEKLKIYTGASFLMLFEHLETPATLQFDGFANVRKFIHTQAIANTTWAISHNLGTKNVLVTPYNSADVEIFQANITSVTTTDVNTVTIVYPVAQTGRAVVIAAI